MVISGFPWSSVIEYTKSIRLITIFEPFFLLLLLLLPAWGFEEEAAEEEDEALFSSKVNCPGSILSGSREVKSISNIIFAVEARGSPRG